MKEEEINFVEIYKKDGLEAVKAAIEETEQCSPEIAEEKAQQVVDSWSKPKVRGITPRSPYEPRKPPKLPMPKGRPAGRHPYHA